MARRIEIFDTTLRDGNKLPFAALSPDDRLLLARQLARLGVDVIEAGFPAASAEESACVRRVSTEVRGPRIAALARALESDVEKAIEALGDAPRPHVHVFMSVSPQFLATVLKETEADAIRSLTRCLRAARGAGVRVQFSLKEAPHGRPEFVRDVCLAARESGAEVINFADTNGILTPERASELVTQVRGYLGGADGPMIGIHCHNDLGLATANSLAAILAGASHVEVTVGGFGERAGNASLEEIAFLISAYGERYGVAHGIHLEEIARTSQLLDSLTGVRTHPNKPVIGQLAFVPAAGGFPGKSLDQALDSLMQEKTIGRGAARISVPVAESKGTYELEAFSVLTGSHTPPVGVVVIRREGRSITQSSHGNGPIDALFQAVDKALGFAPRMVLYSVSTLSAGAEAQSEIIVTVEVRGRRFHGRHTSTDVIEASLRAYLRACNAVGESGILEGPSDFHVAGEYLWE